MQRKLYKFISISCVIRLRSDLDAVRAFSDVTKVDWNGSRFDLKVDGVILILEFVRSPSHSFADF